MSHVQQSTLAIDKSREDISDVLNELWRQGVLIRLEPESDSITIHCDSSSQMTVATATINAGTPYAVDAETPNTDQGDSVLGSEAETITADDVGTIDAANLGLGAD